MRCLKILCIPTPIQVVQYRKWPTIAKVCLTTLNIILHCSWRSSHVPPSVITTLNNTQWQLLIAYQQHLIYRRSATSTYTLCSIRLPYPGFPTLLNKNKYLLISAHILHVDEDDFVYTGCYRYCIMANFCVQAIRSLANMTFKTLLRDQTAIEISDIERLLRFFIFKRQIMFQ